MFFRRPRPVQLTFQDRLDNLQRTGFTVAPQSGGDVLVSKEGCAVMLREASGQAEGVRNCPEAHATKTARFDALELKPRLLDQTAIDRPWAADVQKLSCPGRRCARANRHALPGQGPGDREARVDVPACSPTRNKYP